VTSSAKPSTPRPDGLRKYSYERCPREIWKLLMACSRASISSSTRQGNRAFSRELGSRPTRLSFSRGRLIGPNVSELFGRNDVQAEDLNVFAEWLVVILTVNQAEGALYPLAPTEARSALRRKSAF
jgi:hypothetical protein